MPTQGRQVTMDSTRARTILNSLADGHSRRRVDMYSATGEYTSARAPGSLTRLDNMAA